MLLSLLTLQVVVMSLELMWLLLLLEVKVAGNVLWLVLVMLMPLSGGVLLALGVGKMFLVAMVLLLLAAATSGNLATGKVLSVFPVSETLSAARGDFMTTAIERGMVVSGDCWMAITPLAGDDVTAAILGRGGGGGAGGTGVTTGTSSAVLAGLGVGAGDTCCCCGCCGVTGVSSLLGCGVTLTRGRGVAHSCCGETTPLENEPGDDSDEKLPPPGDCVTPGLGDVSGTAPSPPAPSVLCAAHG